MGAQFRLVNFYCQWSFMHLINCQVLRAYTTVHQMDVSGNDSYIVKIGLRCDNTTAPQALNVAILMTVL